MGKIFCLMGKSSSGKDTIYKRLLDDAELGLRRIVPYTTRPIREGEAEGVEYHFVGEEELAGLQAAGLVVELRAYNTVHGIWKYFTVCDGELDTDRFSYALIGTPESWHAMKEYFGADRMAAIYVEVDDGERLSRALARERSQATPHYAEMCRRFLADLEDFSDEKLESEGITARFRNEDLEQCLGEIKLFVQKCLAV